MKGTAQGLTHSCLTPLNVGFPSLGGLEREGGREKFSLHKHSQKFGQKRKSYSNFRIHASFVFYSFGIAFILSYLFEGPPYNFFRLEASIGRSLKLHLSQRSRILCAFIRNYENSHLKKKKEIPILPQIPNLNPTAPRPPPFFCPGRVLPRPQGSGQ